MTSARFKCTRLCFFAAAAVSLANTFVKATANGSAGARPHPQMMNRRDVLRNSSRPCERA